MATIFAAYTLSAISGVCLVAGIAVLMSGKER